MKAGEDGRYLAFDLLDTIGNQLLLATLEAVTKNQFRTWNEVKSLVDAIASKTISPDELSARLESIQKDLETKIPDEQDRKNIAWVRKYLEHASNAGGKDA